MKMNKLKCIQLCLSSLLILLFINSPLLAQTQKNNKSMGLANKKTDNVLFINDGKNDTLVEQKNGFNLFKYIIVTGFVIAGVCGLMLLLKRFLPGSKLFLSSNSITPLARKQLDSINSIWLIEIGKKVIRIGTSKNGISYLGEISDKEEIAIVKALSANMSKKEEITNNFDNILRAASKDIENRHAVENNTINDVSKIQQEIDGLRDKISTLNNKIES